MTKIIKGNFGPKATSLKEGYQATKAPGPPLTEEQVLQYAKASKEIGRPAVAAPPNELPEQIMKALGIIQAASDKQMSFVIIGIKPVSDGADFYTALHGDPSDLRNAQDHLVDVIARLYDRQGI